MTRGKFLLLSICALYLSLITSARAHTVEQFYASYEKGSGVVVVNFDVAYAMPEIREVPDAPQPMRDWLVAQSDDRHRALRVEAVRYLRDYIEFRSGDETIEFDIKFPDFKASPYAFPKLLNAGAYYNIELEPVLAPDQKVFIGVKAGGFPNLLVAHEQNDEYRFETIKPEGLLELGNFITDEEVITTKGISSNDESEVSFSTLELFVLGFRHVIPDGLDHVLFIIGMCLMAASVRQLLWQSVVFTIAHTLSMALVISQAFPIYTYWISGYIEAIIALSIAFIAVEGLFMKTDFKWKCVVISVFGFVHGLGFAGSLGSTLQFLSAEHWIGPLVLANIGIEIAQAFLVIACFSLLMYLNNAQSPKFERSFRSVTAIAIAGIGVFWFIERLP